MKLLFQPAEEFGAGAKQMVDEGVLEGVDEVYVTFTSNRFTPKLLSLICSLLYFLLHTHSLCAALCVREFSMVSSK